MCSVLCALCSAVDRAFVRLTASHLKWKWSLRTFVKHISPFPPPLLQLTALLVFPSSFFCGARGPARDRGVAWRGLARRGVAACGSSVYDEDLTLSRDSCSAPQVLHLSFGAASQGVFFSSSFFSPSRWRVTRSDVVGLHRKGFVCHFPRAGASV